MQRMPLSRAGTPGERDRYARYSYFKALIGSTRDARCAGMKPAHSATSASATAESASTAGSAPVI